MSKILVIDGQEVSPSLQSKLTNVLRPCDEATILPQCHAEHVDGTLKNVAFRLCGNTPKVPVDTLNAKLFTGISAIDVTGKVEPELLRDPARHASALQALKHAIPSQEHDPNLETGPCLLGDASDCDVEAWTAGFDTSSCFCGLFTAQHSCAPGAGMRGQNRVHEKMYLVVKAGGGIASATFQSRLVAALKGGATLRECLEAPDGCPGPAALRRVSRAGSRNRARILMLAAEAIGIEIESSPDLSSNGRYQLATCDVDCVCNSIRRLSELNEDTYQVTLALDAHASNNFISMSNIADGVVLLLSEHADKACTLRNAAWSTLPFSSVRIASNTEVLDKVCNAHKEARASGGQPHADSHFIHDTFAWNNPPMKEPGADKVEPLAFWGTHAEECYLSKYARELGVSNRQIVRLIPAMVCVSGLECAHLRAVMHALR